MISRRKFIKSTAVSAVAFSVFPHVTSCSKNTAEGELKISLAQWSLNRAFVAGDLDANDFAKIASNSYNIRAVEYVNQFYTDSAKDEKFWAGMKGKADDENVKSLLIMVDDEGDLGDSDKTKRLKSVENHFKWVNAAKLLDGHSIRVNAFGEGTKEVVRSALVDGMGQLSEYAAKEGINVIIENHGLFSSDAGLIVEIINEVNKPNFGTLPDFGNWCLNAKWGSTQNNKCSEVYDRYKGVSEFLPFAKGVSAKSYSFNEKGDETIIDYHKMLQIVKDSGYDGHIGIEYEGEKLSEPEGIKATKALMERVWEGLS